MKKDLVIGIGVGIPVIIIMILIGGGGHSPLDFEREMEKIIIEEPKQVEQTKLTQSSSQDCSGNARCVTGTVTKIVDGDTIHVDGESVRFALASAPELSGYGGVESRNFIQTICPVGSDVTVDEDDGQTGESYGRMIGIIYCNDMNLNEELLDANLGYLENRFCDSSEFANDSWAQKHGCIIESDVSIQAPQTIKNNCDPAYPDVCIPSSPPDLDCGEIEYQNFKVLQPDPHRFDGDKDGIGCES